LIDISSEALDLIEKMLIKDPAKRPSANECLEEEWLWSDEKIEAKRKEKNI
jgi:serine/threonine protein kinase